MLTSKEIRSGFIEFFTERGHRFIPSVPVVPIGDETLLFINAGMNQFKDIFLGLSKPDCARAANTQKCIRVSGKHNDLEEVGIDTYHHTFFEMLGNWSFDDYFKAESIEWAWQLLTDVYGIGADLLWATVFEGDVKEGLPPDEESAGLWAKVTSIPKEKILYCSKKDNFWEMGDTGPCGPCTEIHIDLGADMCDMKNVPGHKCAVNAGCSRFIELWNLVFIQYNRTAGGALEKLAAKYVDTGAGLERIAAVLQNKNSNYDTDLFMPIINAIEDACGCKYTSQLGDKTDNAFRVIADHIRSLTFSITDGVTPSNEGRGYVIRRILRRAARFGRVLDMHEPFMYRLVSVLAGVMGDAFGEVAERAEFVAGVIESEEVSFGRTLDRGLDIFAMAAKTAEKSAGGTISGDDAFQLYDTFGFPLDLTELMARERGLKVNAKTFDELMAQQRARGRTAQKTGSIAMDLSGVELPTTDDSPKYTADQCAGKVVGWISSEGFITEGVLSEVDRDVAIVLDRTCFYAEAGGQAGDCGTIRSSGGATFCVERTERIAGAVAHWGKLLSGEIAVGDEVDTCVDKNRMACKKNHTATHLLQWALQQVVGDSVKQQGSLVCPDYLRFDFTCAKALTAEQVKGAESLVREKISAGLPVMCAVMPIEAARKLGAMALFSEKYGDEVRVVAIGTDRVDQVQQAFSLEFCGGTHLENTGQVGGFKITREESISAGVRRITALTGDKLAEYLGARSGIVDELSGMLNASAGQVAERVGGLSDVNKRIGKLLRSASKDAASDLIAEAGKLFEKTETSEDAGAADEQSQEYLIARSDIVDELSAMLKAPAEQIIERAGKVIDENKKLITQLEAASKETSCDMVTEAAGLLEKCEKVNGAAVVVGAMPDGHIEQARAAIDSVKKKAKSAAIMLGFGGEGGKVTLLCGVTDDLVKKGLSAGDIIRQVAPIVEGGGGGRPQMAQAGGKNPAKLDEALDKAAEIIREKLQNLA